MAALFYVTQECVSEMPEAHFGWKLRCSYGVFDCISALISLDLASWVYRPVLAKSAENRLEMRPNPLETASPCILKHTLALPRRNM